MTVEMLLMLQWSTQVLKVKLVLEENSVVASRNFIVLIRLTLYVIYMLL